MRTGVHINCGSVSVNYNSEEKKKLVLNLEHFAVKLEITSRIPDCTATGHRDETSSVLNLIAHLLLLRRSDAMFMPPCSLP